MAAEGEGNTKAHLFDKQAAAYKKYRPEYSAELFDAVRGLCRAVRKDGRRP